MGKGRGAYRNFLGRSEGNDHLGDPGVDGRIISKWIIKSSKWIFKKWDSGMDWIELAQDGDRWRAVLNLVMNLQVSQNAGNFLIN
jgi:hypothetical protein